MWPRLISSQCEASKNIVVTIYNDEWDRKNSRVVKLSEYIPMPRMMDVNGKFVVAMPREDRFNLKKMK